MPVESRFRLERPFDITEAFSQRRSGSLAVRIDEQGDLFGSPAMPRVSATPVDQRRLALWGGVGDEVARSRLRTPRAAMARVQENSRRPEVLAGEGAGLRTVGYLLGTLEPLSVTLLLLRGPLNGEELA